MALWFTLSYCFFFLLFNNNLLYLTFIVGINIQYNFDNLIPSLQVWRNPTVGCLPVPRLARSLSPVANLFHFSFALNASATATRCGLWRLVVYGSVCSYSICDKIFHVQWYTRNYYISRMTVNKITIWIWRWRVWKVKKVRKTTATYQTARQTGSTTKVNRYRYDS